MRTKTEQAQAIAKAKQALKADLAEAETLASQMERHLRNKDVTGALAAAERLAEVTKDVRDGTVFVVNDVISLKEIGASVGHGKSTLSARANGYVERRLDSADPTASLEPHPLLDL
ncbi:hypothetical protein [Lapillicoccus jejuensis]|uniref:hypothetical protein n=1 Tax=Lapillicoccus jejuensis TaxID=402171 RepID=UPI0011540A22|nr:hypothetical protein [Lapillicoccus jejuensis]